MLHWQHKGPYCKILNLFFFIFYQAVGFHIGKFSGQCTPIDAQIVGQLQPPHADDEFTVIMELRLG